MLNRIVTDYIYWNSIISCAGMSMPAHARCLLCITFPCISLCSQEINVAPRNRIKYITIHIQPLPPTYPLSFTDHATLVSSKSKSRQYSPEKLAAN